MTLYAVDRVVKFPLMVRTGFADPAEPAAYSSIESVNETYRLSLGIECDAVTPWDRERTRGRYVPSGFRSERDQLWYVVIVAASDKPSLRVVPDSAVPVAR